LLLNSSAGKGFIVEIIAHLLLKKSLPPPPYTIYRNVTLPTKDGTTQVDHIVLSPSFDVRTRPAWVRYTLHVRPAYHRLELDACPMPVRGSHGAGLSKPPIPNQDRGD